MSKISKAIAVLSVVSTLFVGLPTTAFSQDFEIYMERGGPRYRDYNEDRRDRRYRDPPLEEYQCTTRQALNIARRYLRNPQIGRTSNDAIEVRGIGRNGERNRVVFGGERGCPRIG